jgi:hypothetical protein
MGTVLQTLHEDLQHDYYKEVGQLTENL